MRRKQWPPVPPFEPPPARTLTVDGIGELFLRDSGGSGPPVMLLHGWTASADLNWWACYRDLQDAGYRVLAIDHRGHGRGLRTYERFSIADCASDAAAAIEALGCAPAVVVGYSMGGAIGQVLASNHPGVVSSLVLSATAQHWRDRRLRGYWRTMAPLSLALAAVLRASVFEAPIDHIEITSRPEVYNPALLHAIAWVREASGGSGDGPVRAKADAVGYA